MTIQKVKKIIEKDAARIIFKTLAIIKTERINRTRMKLKKVFSVVLLTMIIETINAQSPILKIKDSDFEQATFENFDYFKQEFKGVKVIGLGEASHMSGHSITAKIKMVKYLHEQCGFDTLAFESPMYELSVLDEKFKSGNIKKDDFLRNISGVWNIREMNELYFYIAETQKSNRPLTVIGFDSSCFRNRGIGDIEGNYKKFTERLINESTLTIELDSTFYNSVHNVIANAYSHKKVAPSDTLILNEKFELIRNIIASGELVNNDYYSFWKQITDNLQTLYTQNYNPNSRDRQMAENVMYYQKKNNSRMIVWAATYHLANDITSVKKLKGKPTGIFLKEKLGNQYYSIAFVPYQGTAGVNGVLGLMKRKIRTKKHSIEKYINETISENYAFVSLRKLETQKMIKDNELKQANMFAASTYKMDIKKVVDGLFYLKNENLVHYQ